MLIAKCNRNYWLKVIWQGKTVKKSFLFAQGTNRHSKKHTSKSQ